MKYILASTSPRRRELVRLFGFSWEMRGASVDEDSIRHPDPATNVLRTAQLKAAAVAADAPINAIVVGADTTVAIDGHMLNKPTDSSAARKMLMRLRGRTHQVHTGIAVYDKASGMTIADVATIDVPMRDYSDAEIEAYIATGDPLDKAGAYAIQHPGFRPVSEMSGCYAGVVGLPLCHLARALRRLGVEISVDIAQICQVYHDYDCPVHKRILSASGT